MHLQIVHDEQPPEKCLYLFILQLGAKQPQEPSTCALCAHVIFVP